MGRSPDTPHLTAKFWRLAAWFCDDRAWRRRRRSILGTSAFIVRLSPVTRTDRIISELESLGWKADIETDAHQVIATRQGPWIGGRSAALAREPRYFREVQRALALTGQEASTRMDFVLVDPEPPVTRYAPDLSTPEELTGRDRVAETRRRERLGRIHAGTMRAGSNWDNDGGFLDEGVPFMPVNSFADAVRGGPICKDAERKAARGTVIAMVLFSLLLIFMLLAATVRAPLVAADGWLHDHMTVWKWVFLGTAAAGLIGASYGFRVLHPRISRSCAAVIYAGSLALLLTMSARAQEDLDPSPAMLASAIPLAILIVLLGLGLAGLRAAQRQGLLKTAGALALSILSLGGLQRAVGWAFAEGLGVHGWTADLPVTGVLYAMAPPIGLIAALAVLLAIGVALINTSSPGFASVFALLGGLMVLTTLPILLLQPYSAGYRLRYGSVLERWEAVADRGCVTSSEDHSPIEPTQTYYLVKGLDGQAVLVPGHPLAVQQPLLVARDSVALEVAPVGATCPARVAP